MARYSFPVGLFHPLQHAGLSQRTLPLHVAWGVHTTAGERLYMIDHVTWASTLYPTRRRTWLLMLKLMLCGGASLDLALAISNAGRAFIASCRACASFARGARRGNANREQDQQVSQD